MGILLPIFYWVMGYCMAFGAAFALGMAGGALIALAKAWKRPENLRLAGGCLAVGAIPALLVWFGYFLAGWIGARTGQAGQWALVVGAIFPGLFALAFVPACIGIAFKQASGLDGELGLPGIPIPNQGGGSR